MPDLALLLNPNLIEFYDPLGKPHEIPEEGIFDAPAVNVCINSRWAGHVSGMIARLITDDAWQGNDDERYAAVNEVLKLLDALGNPDNIGDCNNMANGCCNENLTVYRINSEGTPQVSTDGGETWGDLPEFGSPLNPRSYYPPVTGTDEADIRCKVANSVTWFFHNLQHQYHAALVAEVEQLALAAIFEGALLVIGIVPFSLLAIVGTTIALLVAQKNAADFEAEFPSDFWDKLCEAAYCDVDAAGVYINTDPRQIINDVITSFGASFATAWLDKVMGVFSGSALTNTGAAGFDEGIDCSGFDCIGVCEDIESFHLFNQGSTTFGEILDITSHYVEVKTTFYAGDGGWYLTIGTEDITKCCFLTEIENVTDSGVDNTYQIWLACEEDSTLSALEPTGNFMQYIQLGYAGEYTIRLHFTDGS